MSAEHILHALHALVLQYEAAIGRTRNLFLDQDLYAYSICQSHASVFVNSLRLRTWTKVFQLLLSYVAVTHHLPGCIIFEHHHTLLQHAVKTESICLYSLRACLPFQPVTTGNKHHDNRTSSACKYAASASSARPSTPRALPLLKAAPAYLMTHRCHDAHLRGFNRSML